MKKDYIEVNDCGKKVNNLYNQILPITHPTLAVIGIPVFTLPFITSGMMQTSFYFEVYLPGRNNIFHLYVNNFR